MTNNRIIFLDIMRIVAIYSVIIIHSTNFLKFAYNDVSMEWWWIGNLYHTFSSWAVPVLIMISGTLLLNPQKEYPIKIFLKKRFKKVFLPFIFWGIIYLIWRYRTNILKGEVPYLNILKDFIVSPIYY